MNYCYIIAPDLDKIEKSKRFERLSNFKKTFYGACQDLIISGYTPLCPFSIAFEIINPFVLIGDDGNGSPVVNDDDFEGLKALIESYKNLRHLSSVAHFPMMKHQADKDDYSLVESDGIPIMDNEDIRVMITGTSNERLSFHPVHNMGLAENIISTLAKLRRTLLKKNHDYGDSNILLTGETGVVVRLSDKICRLLNLFGYEFDISQSELNPPKDPNLEAIEDTWLDAIGYSVIGYMVRQNLWNRSEETKAQVNANAVDELYDDSPETF